MGRWLIIACIFLLFLVAERSQKIFFRIALPIFFFIGLSYPLRKEVIIVCFILIFFSCIINKNYKIFYNKNLFVYAGFFVFGYCPKGVCINTYSSCIHTGVMSSLTNLEMINLSNYITSISPPFMDIEIYKICEFLGFTDTIYGGYIPHLLGVLNSNDYLSLFVNGLDYLISLPSLSLTLFLTILFGSFVSLIAPVLFLLYLVIKLMTIFISFYLIVYFKSLIPEEKIQVLFALGFIFAMSILRPIQSFDRHNTYLLIPIVYLLAVSSKQLFKNFKLKLL